MTKLKFFRMPVEPPEGWGDDTLSAYLHDVHGNHFATFTRKPMTADLIEIDRIFIRGFKDGLNVTPWQTVGFFLRSLSAFRVAACCSMAGQVFESYAMCRLVLEHAGTGAFIGADEALWEQWMRRGDTDATRKKARETFSAGAIRRAVIALDAPLGDVYSQLYERCIDFGAHPNEAGYSQSTSIRKEADRVHFDTLFLHEGGLQMDLAIKTACQCGIAALRLAVHVFPRRMQLLGVDDDVKAIAARF